MDLNFKTLKDLDLSDKRVLLRADLNVPCQNGNVTDTTRIDRLLPTIDYLRDQDARVLILSHFGRPKGEPDPALSLSFLPQKLKERWGVDVLMAADCIGPEAQAVADKLGVGDIALLENLRFHPGEKSNDPEFAKELAKLGDIYVNDAFSASHRAHASTEAIARLLPSCAGLLMEQELNALNMALENPEKPVAAIAGGSKISTKLSILNNLVEKVDYLVLGGAMANTFLHAQGANVGGSMCEKDMADEAKKIMETAGQNNCEIVLPSDVVIVEELGVGAENKTVPSNDIPENWRAVDAGPESRAHIAEILKTCKTVVWNGPMGVFEIKPFDAGTNAIAQAAAKLTQDGKLASIAGGGDTAAALENAGCADDFTYISTAGGAFLEWLEGKMLPGVAALK